MSERLAAIPLEAFKPRRTEFTIDELDDPAVLAQAAEAVKLEARAAGQREADALMAAGWRFEIPSESATEPWQWYWYAPPKRKNSNGRKYLSTSQAFNAMQKAKP